MNIFSGLKHKLTVSLDERLGPTFYSEFDKNPIVIYDVGAAGGVYTPFKSGAKEWAQVVGFEPNLESYEELRERINSKNIRIFPVAITDQDAPVTLYAGVDRSRTQSSLMPIEELGLEQRPMPVNGMRLDSLTAKLNIPPPDFLKLDAEGSEDKILRGGTKMLSDHILGIRIEVSFWKDGAHGALFAEVDALLNRYGFILFDLQTNRSDVRYLGGRKDKIRSGDALYLRNFDSISEAVTSKPILRRKLLKLISIAVAWRYLNYALELADYGRAKSLLSQVEFKTITEPWLSTVDISDRIPHFRGRIALARLFDFLSYIFNPNIKKGVPYIFNGLGNHWVVSRMGTNPNKVQLHCAVLKLGRKNRKKIINIPSSPSTQKGA
tara:strand:- start:1712 stop:2851 length:1140 start_codon:yes stop_codon:yes gene_type:complete